jgi:uncharacterized protein with PIN domain
MFEFIPQGITLEIWTQLRGVQPSAGKWKTAALNFGDVFGCKTRRCGRATAVVQGADFSETDITDATPR